jgi:tRNA pseudouridine55 synthase
MARVRISLRSKSPRVDVSKVCGQFGGGGHTLAAGARARGSLADVQERVLAAIDTKILRTEPRLPTQERNQELDGVLLVDKASGMTSHDVVAIVRRACAPKKVGHCGTLDPLATGLLIHRLGRGTKIQDLLMSEDKEYVGSHDSRRDDRQPGRRWQGHRNENRARLHREQIDAAFAKFHGDFYQMPPMVSAIKKDGVPLYKLARPGQDRRARAALRPRLCTRDSSRAPARDRLPRRLLQRLLRAHLRFDIGNELGCGAHLKRCVGRRAVSSRSNIL